MDELSPQPILDGELLRAFAVFAEVRNFSHAAKQVGLSQPALFERVKRLADHVGAPLYEKDGRTLKLTPTGVRIAAFARDMLTRTGRLAGELKGETAESVTLAAGEGAYLYLLGPALSRFLATDRALLRVLTRGGPSAIEAVQSGEAHLAVGVFDLVPGGVVAKDLVRAPLCAAFSAQHPLARKRTVKLSDLAGERLILAPEGQRQRDLIGRAIASLGVPVAPPVEADGWPLMLAFAAAGLGVAVVNGICRPTWGAVLRPVPELGSVTYRLLMRRDAPRSEALERLVSLVQSTAGTASGAE
ncbi:LysR family transcriptional regulator [Archangium sp.]|uniref:LysR family transcriptional regulator n=1 Tax=Archangium sp. TaxID=1872627 RepID=UPI00389ADBCB